MKLWLWWTLATIGGSVVGALVLNVTDEALLWVLYLFYGAFGFGLGGAVLQALVLPGRWTHAVSWALATSVATTVSGKAIVDAGTALVDLNSPVLEGVSLVLFMLTELGVGLLVGTCQWLVLRRLVGRAGWWIPVSGLSLILGWYVAGSVTATMLGTSQDPNENQTLLVSMSVHGIIYGAVTGYLLVRLRRSRSPDAGDTTTARP